MPVRTRLKIVPLHLLLLGGAVIPAKSGHAQLVGPPAGEPRVEVLKDFIAHFDEATERNTIGAKVRENARTDQVILPGINLHPTGEGDSVLSFAGVPVPPCATGEQVFLLFRIGMSDGIKWDYDPKPNGVRFSVAIDDEVRFEEEVAELGWRARAVDLTPWAGQDVAVEFRTNAIDGNVAYDWAFFGQPEMVRCVGEELDRLPEDTVGVALAEVKCTEPATVALSMGEASESAPLPPGTHWLPLHFTQTGDLHFAVESGTAELLSARAAPAGYRVEPRELALGSPLVVAGRPFSLFLKLENTGEGVYPGGDSVALASVEGADLRELGAAATEPAPIGRIGPGEEAIVQWGGLLAREPGDWELTAALGDTQRSIGFHIFPPEPSTAGDRPTGAEVLTQPNEPFAARVGNAWSRLSLVVDLDRHAYAIAETWNGEQWQRIGSLYPLARVIVLGAAGEHRELRLAVQAIESLDGRLVLRGEAGDGGDAPWPVRTAFRPDAEAPRIQVECTLEAPRDADLLAFYAPTLLAGDRAYGAGKDFAIFPGVEYLEGDEESSSPRDLAPPLHDRRVPVFYKVATPLMAVQGDDSLAALMWDANQEWAPDQQHPAARFLAPKQDSGLEYTHMSLFTPSVGSYVEENRYEATTPYQVEPGQRLRLSEWLVLDHKVWYERDSIVHGPHEGGLVLQAMQHWFDVFGLPKPSPQPRDWEAERALSREAYLHSLWSDDPPGWRSHTNAELETNVKLIAPLLLDLAAGVPPDVEAEVQRRIDLVLERALQEGGLAALLSSNRVFLPFFHGYLPEALAAFRGRARGMMGGREDGLWVWRPGDDEHRTLGVPGTHTLGQATWPSLVSLRAARYTGDPQLAAEALEAMRQMERYEVPRGASMWECPQYQPDLFASALAIKAYCEAYRLTGDADHLAHARYWAWTGLPFLYTWQMDADPTMLYNSIGVIGSTFYTHSWLGRPVVWMGLDYAYALQDLAEFDDSFPWLTVAQGITNSAMWQQYADGESKGCFPDSWEMAENRPNPADINPELILLNEYRLRGQSLHIRHDRFDGGEPPVFLNSPADIVATSGDPEQGRVEFELKGIAGLPTYSVLAPVAEPAEVSGAGERAADGESLQVRASGWLYDPELRMVVLKHGMPAGRAQCAIRW